jgi:hypothetical protein
MLQYEGTLINGDNESCMNESKDSEVKNIYLSSVQHFKIKHHEILLTIKNGVEWNKKRMANPRKRPEGDTRNCQSCGEYDDSN